jgi:hypothetical protein
LEHQAALPSSLLLSSLRGALRWFTATQKTARTAGAGFRVSASLQWGTFDNHQKNDLLFSWELWELWENFLEFIFLVICNTPFSLAGFHTTKLLFFSEILKFQKNKIEGKY